MKFILQSVDILLKDTIRFLLFIIFLAVDRVIPEQMKRFEEEVRQHVEEESQKQRYLLNVIYLSVVSYQENGI